MLSVVKRNILKGKSPSSLGRGGKRETRRKIQKKNTEERVTSWLCPAMPQPPFSHSITHTCNIGLYFYSSSLTSELKKIVFFRIFLLLFLPTQQFYIGWTLHQATIVPANSANGCNCFLMSSVRGKVHTHTHTRTRTRTHTHTHTHIHIYIYIALCYKPEGFGFDTRWGEFLKVPNPSDRTRPWGLLSL
jgi:hypothetical protein